jgi:hypothetical protein
MKAGHFFPTSSTRLIQQALLTFILRGKKVGYNLRSSMIATRSMISIPITLEQLITAVQQLQPDERAKVARALVEVDLRSDLTALIQELYDQPPVDGITDNDIMAEIKAVRQQSHQA